LPGIAPTETSGPIGPERERGVGGSSVLAAPTGIRDAAHYMPQLEALRGVAILLVFFFHADVSLSLNGYPVIGTWVSPLAAFVHAGHTGVTLFFVLSAFLLSRPFLAEARGGRPVSRTRFLARRALRILPLYWLAVILFSWLDDSNGSLLSKAVPHMLLLDSFPGATVRMFGYSDVWWSLSTEAQFYIVLPLCTLLLRRRFGRGVFLVLLLAYLGSYFYLESHNLSPQLWVNLFGRGPAFLIGVGAAWFYESFGLEIRERCSRWGVARWGGGDIVLVALVLALGYLLREVVFMGVHPAEWRWHAWHVYEALLWASIVIVTLVLPLRLGSLLTNRVMGTVGILSYSLYLFHFPVLFETLRRCRVAMPKNFLGWTAISSATVLMCLALALGVSALTYLLIERPVLKRKARIAD
jgi:peptidoglycan/LPS O-acetylase OafA/YrhL